MRKIITERSIFTYDKIIKKFFNIICFILIFFLITLLYQKERSLKATQEQVKNLSSELTFSNQLYQSNLNIEEINSSDKSSYENCEGLIITKQNISILTQLMKLQYLIKSDKHPMPYLIVRDIKDKYLLQAINNINQLLKNDFQPLNIIQYNLNLFLSNMNKKSLSDNLVNLGVPSKIATYFSEVIKYNHFDLQKNEGDLKFKLSQLYYYLELYDIHTAFKIFNKIENFSQLSFGYDFKKFFEVFF